jgi:glycerophosphoryl diester phosphodiesterase
MKDSTAIPLTLQAIQQYDLQDRVIFGAVDYSINKAVQQQKPSSIPICADIQSMMNISQAYKQGRLNEKYPFEHDILGVFLESHTRAMLTPHLIETIHRTGRPLAIVGSLLDDPTVQKEMIELGVDILFTDRPDVLRQTLDSYSKK